MSAIALYTAVYPAADRFLASWYTSVQAQTDRDFDLWISLDGLTEATVEEHLGTRPVATFVVAEPGSTPAQVRQEVRRRIGDLAPGGGFVFNPVHNIQAGTPVRNIVAMFDALDKYRATG